MSTVLLTGGAGYIGSHIAVLLLERGHEVVVFDNFCNSNIESLKRVERITGASLHVVEGDVRDAAALNKLFETYVIDGTIHLAGLKAVGDSVSDPMTYHDNNVVGSLRLFEAARRQGSDHILFSSSATVYGEPHYLPMDEKHPLNPVSPYGKSKRIVEMMMEDIGASSDGLSYAILRYFNPIGAHPSGQIGEDPSGVPNNLLPYITQVGIGLRSALNVWGDDYETPDGTGVRDYIHVMDLAHAHVLALEHIIKSKSQITLNLGTGQGRSVLEVVKAFETASGNTIPLNISPRRPGDIASYYADPKLAKVLIKWEAQYDLLTMCRDNWNWQKQNPKGYKSA